MSRILVALATTRHSDELGRRAVVEAEKKGASITLLLVAESEEIDRIHQLKSDPLLLGTRELDEILGEIEEEHRRMLDEHAGEIERLAGDRGVSVERIEASGRYDRLVGDIVAHGDYEVVYWLKHSRGFVARFFLGADQDEIVRVEPRAR